MPGWCCSQLQHLWSEGGAMSDILERLRETAECADYVVDREIAAEAAAEIEQLRRAIGSMLLEREEAKAEAERLRAELERAAEVLEQAADDLYEYASILSREPFVAACVDAAARAVRAALTATPAQKKENE